jgi:uncharacterized protein (TIGR02145 family)
MKTIKQTFKKSATLATIFFLFFTLNTKAQDLSGTYTIQRATDGVLNRNVGTVEIKELVYRDTSVKIAGKKTEYNEITYYNEWGHPLDLDANGKIVKLSDGYHIVSTFIPNNQYQFIEKFGDQVTKRIITINGNGSGTYGNQVDISSPLTNFQNLNQVEGELVKSENGRSIYNEYLWDASLEPGVIVRKHVNREHQELYDITELLVKQGSVQEQNWWVMSQWLIDLTKSWEQRLVDKAQRLVDMAWTDNLNVSKFINGEIIPEAKSVAAWQAACKAKKPVWCFYKFDPANGVKYGKIYNYYAVNDKRGLAPKGFHIATEADFDLLQSSLETYDNYGEKEYVFTNEFKEQLGGYFNGQIFDLAEPSTMLAGKWWTSTKRVVDDGYNYRTETFKTHKEILVYELQQDKWFTPIDGGARSKLVKYQEFEKNWRLLESIYIPQDEGYSVRCVKD